MILSLKQDPSKSDCVILATDLYFLSRDQATKIETSALCCGDDDKEESR